MFDTQAFPKATTIYMIVSTERDIYVYIALCKIESPSNTVLHLALLT